MALHLHNKEERLIRQVSQKGVNSTGQLFSDFSLPNTSGDHSRGIKRLDPTRDEDLVNKKYVDTQLSTTILPAIDDTYDLGSLAKRWAQVFAVIAILGSLVIGNNIGLSNVSDRLLINASADVNGSLYIFENITAVHNISATTFFGDGSQLTGIATGNNITGDHNISGDTLMAGFVSVGRLAAVNNIVLQINKLVDVENLFGLAVSTVFSGNHDTATGIWVQIEPGANANVKDGYAVYIANAVISLEVSSPYGLVVVTACSA